MKTAEQRDSEFDTDGTDDATCPYCGHVNQDSWEINLCNDYGEHDCHECNKTMLLTRNVSVSYSSAKKPT